MHYMATSLLGVTPTPLFPVVWPQKLGDPCLDFKGKEKHHQRHKVSCKSALPGCQLFPQSRNPPVSCSWPSPRQLSVQGAARVEKQVLIFIYLFIFVVLNLYSSLFFFFPSFLSASWKGKLKLISISLEIFSFQTSILLWNPLHMFMLYSLLPQTLFSLRKQLFIEKAIFHELQSLYW